MGTQYYDNREHRYGRGCLARISLPRAYRDLSLAVDCPITDVIQMMGRASRPLQVRHVSLPAFFFSPEAVDQSVAPCPVGAAVMKAARSV